MMMGGNVMFFIFKVSVPCSLPNCAKTILFIFKSGESLVSENINLQRILQVRGQQTFCKRPNNKYFQSLHDC